MPLLKSDIPQVRKTLGYSRHKLSLLFIDVICYPTISMSQLPRWILGKAVTMAHAYKGPDELPLRDAETEKDRPGPIFREQG